MSSSEEDEQSLPNNPSNTLTVENGIALTAARITVAKDLPFTLVVRERLDTVIAIVRALISDIPTSSYEEKTVFKRSANYTQRKFTQLTVDNFEPKLDRAWRIAKQRRGGHPINLQFELFTYCRAFQAPETPIQKHRRTLRPTDRPIVLTTL